MTPKKNGLDYSPVELTTFANMLNRPGKYNEKEVEEARQAAVAIGAALPNALGTTLEKRAERNMDLDDQEGAREALGGIDITAYDPYRTVAQGQRQETQGTEKP